MRSAVLSLAVALLMTTTTFVHSAHGTSQEPEVSLYAPTVKVGSLQFTVPSKWQSQAVTNPARAGQWRVPPLHGEGDPGEVVVFYFGPGIGGSPRENIDAWVGSMANADGHPTSTDEKHHVTTGFKISQVAIFGTYSQTVPLPAIPPVARANYGLLGAVIENPQGNIYWRFTGPEALIIASLPLFNKIIDSVKPQAK